MSTSSSVLSEKQRQAVRALARGMMTTEELKGALGVKKGIAGLLQALYQRGVIRYAGGGAKKKWNGRWELTAHGHAMAGDAT